MSFSGKVVGWVNRIRDGSASYLLQRVLQASIERYGRMLKLSIDSRDKTVQCEVLLKGESEPITLTARDYELVTEGSDAYLVVQKAAASREWLSVMIDQFVVGKKIPIPEKYQRLLKLVL